MRIKITKSIKIADKSPSMPTATVKEGETREDLSEHICRRLIELECAVSVDESESDVVDEVTDETGDGTEGEGSDVGGDANHGDESGDTSSETVSEDVTIEPQTVRETLDAMVSEIEDEQEQKTALETWGKNVLGVDIDKRKGVKKLIKILVTEAKKQGK